MRWWRWSPHNVCHWRDQRGRTVSQRRAGAARAAASWLRVPHGRRQFRSKRPVPRASLGGWSTWASSPALHRRARSIGAGCRAVAFELPARVVGQCCLDREVARLLALCQGVRYRGTCPWRQVPSGRGANPRSRGPTRLENFRYEALGYRRGLRGVKAVVSAPVIQMCCGGLVKRAFLQGYSWRSVTRRWCGLARRRPPSWLGMAVKSRPACFLGMPNRALTSRNWVSNRTTHNSARDFACLTGASVRCDV